MTIKELTNLLQALLVSAPAYPHAAILRRPTVDFGALSDVNAPARAAAPAVKCEAEDDWGKQELSRHHVGNGSRK